MPIYPKDDIQIRSRQEIRFSHQSLTWPSSPRPQIRYSCANALNFQVEANERSHRRDDETALYTNQQGKWKAGARFDENCQQEGFAAHTA
jgi:hypothetical protein